MSQIHDAPVLNRRQALKVAATVTAAGGLAASASVQAQEAIPAEVSILRTVGNPPLPSPAVLALSRLAFGHRPGDAKTSIDYFNSIGLDAWVDEQLNPAGIADAECDNLIAAAGLGTLSKSLTQLWADHYKNFNNNYDIRIQPWLETRVAALIRATASRRQLFEVMADFWYNHFNVFAADYGGASATLPHYYFNVIRPHVFGNFRTLLEKVAKAPAMLFYLDNNSSQGANFNENFARELCELHTLGAENYLGVVEDPTTVPKITFPPDGQPVAVGYVDNDVYEIARCLTGWRVNDDRTWLTGITNTGEFQYWSEWHDRANKFVLGRYYPPNRYLTPVDGQQALDLLAYHPRTATFISRKLCRRLIGDTPPQSIVDSAAALFQSTRTAPDQLKQVVRHIALSNEFRTTWAQKAKRPFELFASALRACNKPFTLNKNTPNNASGYSQLDSFFWTFNALGQPLFERRPPDGFPDVREVWTGTNTQVRYWNLINTWIEGFDWAFPALKPDLAAQMPGTVNTPTAITDYWINRVLGRAMHPAANRDLLMGMMQGWNANPTWKSVTPIYNPTQVMVAADITERLPRMVALLLMAPDIVWR